MRFSLLHTCLHLSSLFLPPHFLSIKLIDALESHVSNLRTTMRRKLLKQGRSTSCSSSIKPRAASMAVEVRKSGREGKKKRKVSWE